ncbi:MAG: exodeoxyribonuclease VII large subunit [Desulfobacterota bacterium]|nr:exodeoxyribonuclease VII large subunit [Thermodesulfobacteriota bacterium]
MQLPFRYILTVTELTQQIKEMLEERFPDLWVEGEISNLRIPPSGHLYFTLKDDLSQIRAVLFRTQARTLKFLPEDGLHVICRGRIGLYEKRGEYQLILEAMEPKGLGALQLAFLQLKERLEKEGLFDPSHKKPLPFLPQTIGIITSPTGAVIQDMIRIIHRRFENVRLLLYPVRVQGEGAPQEIVEAIGYFNRCKNVDVIIVGRGGGALEDLWAFNDEAVARAIYRSKIPIISAVGHETDYTIADFVADLRAPTPSAAAEMVVRDKREVQRQIEYLRYRLETTMGRGIGRYRSELAYLLKALVDPKRRIEEAYLRLDDLGLRFRRSLFSELGRRKEAVDFFTQRLHLQNPAQKIKRHRSALADWGHRLNQRIGHLIEVRREAWRGIVGKLESLNPLAVLERGYSLTRKMPSLDIVRDYREVTCGEEVEVTLSRGRLHCRVEDRFES